MTDWPDIPYPRWAPTGDSLHMWAQIVGKFRFSLTPWINHSWQAAFYVTSRGLTTSLIPGPQDSYEVVFDFLDHRLNIHASDGRTEGFALDAMSVAKFHQRFLDRLARVGAPLQMHHAPNEVPNPRPFAEQTDLGEYDREAVRDFWRALLKVDAVLKHFRTGFLGKASPVHLFWGSFDLATTRFSGRAAPRHPGGIPSLPDAVTREAYSHEVSSCGFWPGAGVGEPSFYSYAYPRPAGFSDASAGVPEASFNEQLGEFVLPYDAVRTASDPSVVLFKFLQSTYEAAANLGGWDRGALECEFGVPKKPRSSRRASPA